MAVLGMIIAQNLMDESLAGRATYVPVSFRISASRRCVGVRIARVTRRLAALDPKATISVAVSICVSISCVLAMTTTRVNVVSVLRVNLGRPRSHVRENWGTIERPGPDAGDDLKWNFKGR